MYTETEDKYILQITAECGSCNGTGLYVGMAERDGCAVECSTCKGTGQVEIKHEYKKFKGRNIKKGVNRVFKTSCGYVHSDKDVIRDEGKTIYFSRGGCTYEEWLNGAEPKPVEDLYCPYIFTNQDMQRRDHPAHAFYKSNCDNTLGSMIQDCKMFREKEKCWKKFHSLTKK